MADRKTLAELMDDFRDRAEAGHKKARFRIGLTGVLMVVVCGYMGWLYHNISKLDAQAITEIARAEVQSRLPEVGEQLEQMAIDAAPAVIDHAETAILAAPGALRDSVESRLLSGTEAVIDDTARNLDQQLTAAIAPNLAALKAASGDAAPTLDQLVTSLRKSYRASVEGMTGELYLAYAREISGVEDFLVRLKTAEDLTPRERVQKEIIEASVALRRRFVEPIEPTSLTVGETD